MSSSGAPTGTAPVCPHSRLCHGGPWKFQYDAEPGAIVLKTQLDPVQFGHRGDQAEAETAAGRRSAAVQAHETLQNAGAVRHRDTWAAIVDRDHRTAVAQSGRKLDRRTFRGMDERILYEVGQHLGQQFRIAPYGSRPADLRPELPPGILGHDTVSLVNARADLGKIDIGEALAAAAGLDLRNAGSRHRTEAGFTLSGTNRQHGAC